MNVIFFLIPKSHVAYLTEGCSLREGLERLCRCGYTSVPVISGEGKYLGAVSEGDFLHNIMGMGSVDPADLEAAPVDAIISDRAPAVRVNTSVAELWERVMEQSFVPVVDDRDMFMGIVTRRSVMAYLVAYHGAGRRDRRQARPSENAPKSLSAEGKILSKGPKL